MRLQIEWRVGGRLILVSLLFLGDGLTHEVFSFVLDLLLLVHGVLSTDAGVATGNQRQQRAGDNEYGEVSHTTILHQP